MHHIQVEWAFAAGPYMRSAAITTPTPEPCMHMVHWYIWRIENFGG